MEINKLLFKTPRLTIEKINLNEDITSLLSYHNDQETMQWIPNKMIKYQKADILNKFKGYHKIGNIELGIYKIVIESSNTIIGEIGFFPVEKYNDAIELGYIIRKEYWSKGLGSELVKGVIDYLSLIKDCNKVVAQLYIGNERSKRLCIKMEFNLINRDQIKSTYLKQLHQQ